MRRLFLILISLVIVGGFAFYMMTYTVRFTDTAVVATFGQADERSIVEEPGLKFKWPAPVQSVTVYDKRARFLQTRSETQQTADDRQIIVESYMTWRVTDPLRFYKSFRSGSTPDSREHYRKAEDTLRSFLRSAMSEVSKYRLSDLFSAEARGSKLPNLEGDVLARLRGQGETGGQINQYGITIDLVGINRIVLPEQTTSEVFERMKESRNRIAAEAEGEGQASASRIRSEAENDARRIRSFAELHAAAIRDRGDLEAAEFLKALNEDPQLAVFLKFIELLRDGIGRNSTVVLPTDMAGFIIFGPDAMRAVSQGKVPEFFPDQSKKTTDATPKTEPSTEPAAP
ncbi:MAG TPA: SPFH domain-containing protein [Phycisphaerales bacterium]|nr:SPFH domain-containing protein [Phycisphaerales bacterium]